MAHEPETQMGTKIKSQKNTENEGSSIELECITLNEENSLQQLQKESESFKENFITMQFDCSKMQRQYDVNDTCSDKRFMMKYEKSIQKHVQINLTC